MVAKDSKKKVVDTPKKDKKVKPTKEEEEIVPAVSPKQDKKKKEKKEKKEKKVESEEEKPVEKKEKKDKKKKDKKKKDKKEKKEEKKEESEEEEEKPDAEITEAAEDNKRKRDDEEEAEEEVEQNPTKVSKSDSSALPPVVYISRLSFQIQEEGLKEFLADCGEIQSIEWINDANNKFCGAAVVTFSDMSSVSKAVAKNGQEVEGRAASIDAHKDVPSDCNTLFIGGLPKSLDENEVKQLLADAGVTPSSFRFPTDRMSGEYKGIAFIEFETPEQAKEAYNSKIHTLGYMGRSLRVDPTTSSQKEGAAGGRGGGRGGFGGNGGGRGGGFGGGRGGGFGGGRGGRGGFGDRGGRGGRGGFGDRGGRGGFRGGRGGGGAGGKRTTFDD